MKIMGFLFVFITGFSAWGVESADGVLLFARGTWSATLHWEQGPVVGQEARLLIDWKDQTKKPVPAPGNFTVVPWMSTMGHGAPPVKIQPVRNGGGQPIVGSYEVSEIYLVMAGDWDIRVDLTVGGHSETETLKVSVPGLSSHH